MLTFEDLIENLKSLFQNETSILKDFTFLPEQSDEWIWIQDHKKIIGDLDAHYELIKLTNKNFLAIDIHFEGKRPNDKSRFEKEIGNTLPSNFKWFGWQRAKSIRYNKHFDLNSPTVLTDIRDAFLYIDNTIGDTIRIIKTNNKLMTYKETEIEYAPSFPTHGQFQKDFIKSLQIPNEIKRVNIKYKDQLYSDLTLGQDGAGYGRVYFPNKGIEFTTNNPELNGGEKITIEVGWKNILEDTSPVNGKLTKVSLNTILYGPPGTGKTFNTINKAIAIVNPDFNFKDKTREEVRSEYKKFVDSKHIEFCTFHQSLSYEDFIEGLKPVIVGDNSPIQYKILPGIFKRIATRAAYKPDVQTKVFSITDEQFAKAQFYKMSLGDSKDVEDDAIFQYCIDNGCIALGWGDDVNFNGKSEREITQMANNKEIERFEGIAVNYFIHFIKPGDYVMISKGNTVLRAIGKIIGDYDYKADSPIRFHQFRKVEWILKDKDIPVNELYNKNFSQQTIYQLDKKQIKKEFFVKAETAVISTPQNPENFVLIIDEINRGNISAIFGELITLLEEDKRKGNKEHLSATLPYSGESFSVPNNLYIIGTMNTADRSVEALDSALRRRFSFEEMLPKSSLLVNDGIDRKVSGISLKNLLDVLNERIGYLLDDDHRIGHSYFLDIAENDINALRFVLKNKIIPLLREYFYNDYEKIAMVLGDKFIVSEDNSPKFASHLYEDLGKTIFKFVAIDDNFDIIDALKSTIGE